jgi:hypothetical protein
LEFGALVSGLRLEDVEDESVSVDDFGSVRAAFREFDRLGRREVVVEHDDPRAGLRDRLSQLLGLSAAELERGVLGSALGQFGDDLVAGGLGQLPNLRGVRTVVCCALGDNCVLRLHGEWVVR